MTAEAKNINVQIGKRLQEVRENLGCTQETFAEALNVEVAHYRKLEKGRYALSTDKMNVLYEKYRVDPTYLITGDFKSDFDFELYVANCGREERVKFIKRMLAYINQLALRP